MVAFVVLCALIGVNAYFENIYGEIDGHEELGFDRFDVGLSPGLIISKLFTFPQVRRIVFEMVIISNVS